MANTRKAKKKGAVKKDAARNKIPISNNINSEAIAAALSKTHLPVLLKVCRLCETKDGPFLNIFDIDKLIAKKIEDVMPFTVTENDDLPHKICFRCSAKVEELHEFIQKCVKTQINLRRAIGNKTPLSTKVKHRILWEEKLNESNISNDDLCDALIKKAMESIKASHEETISATKKDCKESVKEPVRNITKDNIKEKSRSSPSLRHENLKPKAEVPVDTQSLDDSDNPLKRLKVQIKNNDNTPSSDDCDIPLKRLKQPIKNIDNTPSLDDSDIPLKRLKLQIKNIDNTPSSDDCDIPLKRLKLQMKNNDSNKSTPNEDTLKDVNCTSKLRKSAPNDGKRESIAVETTPPKSKLLSNPPELKASKPTCGSLNTNTFSLDDSAKPEDAMQFNILDHVSMIKVNSVGVLYQCKLCNRNFLKKDIILTHGCAKSGGVKKGDIAKELPKPEPPKMPTVKYINTKVNVESKKPVMISEPINLDDDVVEDIKPLKTEIKKPRIGPASKVRKNFQPDVPPANPVVATAPQAPIVQFPQAPSVNSRYKLVPGPNNTFTLLEEGSVNPMQSSIDSINTDVPETLKSNQHHFETKAAKKVTVKATIPQPQSDSQPYPVGLFQTVAHNSKETLRQPPAFTTPAMKKQSYTIVQTGNPNKLLISTKPDQASPKKKPKKIKHDAKVDEPSKQPFSVTLEDAAPPQDSGFFTFINVDPLLQPSYVLPTDNIIQESQITTTNNVNKKPVFDNKKDMKYTCNMCNEKFDREKKLLAHIQSHYNKMDQEDEVRNEKKKTRTRK